MVSFWLNDLIYSRQDRVDRGVFLENLSATKHKSWSSWNEDLA